LCKQYVGNAGTALDCTKLSQELGSPFDSCSSQDAYKFLLMIMLSSTEMHLLMHHTVNVYARCRRCGTQSLDTWDEYIAEFVIPPSCKTIKFDDLLKASFGWMQSENVCVNCHGYEDIRKDIVKAGSMLVFRLNVCQLVNGKSCPRKTSVTAVHL